MRQDQNIIPGDSPLLLKFRMRTVEIALAKKVQSAKDDCFVGSLKTDALNCRSATLLDVAAKLMLIHSGDADDAAAPLQHGVNDPRPPARFQLGLDDLHLVFRKMTLSDNALADGAAMINTLKSVVAKDGIESMQNLVKKLQKLRSLHDGDAA